MDIYYLFSIVIEVSAIFMKNKQKEHIFTHYKMNPDSVRENKYIKFYRLLILNFLKIKFYYNALFYDFHAIFRNIYFFNTQ